MSVESCWLLFVDRVAEVQEQSCVRLRRTATKKSSGSVLRREVGRATLVTGIIVTLNSSRRSSQLIYYIIAFRCSCALICVLRRRVESETVLSENGFSRNHIQSTLDWAFATRVNATNSSSIIPERVLQKSKWGIGFQVPS